MYSPAVVSQVPLTLTLSLLSLSLPLFHLTKLYEAGMTPVVKESPGDEDFRRTRGKVSWEFVEEV